ncbi:DNA polymerase III subunit delta' [Oscillatoria sp. FACHB-1407]|uniref:DNA polymerase III subunit delta' n=1 Tax=Oscillatoria sp. FACHB-1407 TaxID=2692847 RepID=UPI0016834566|nr:DNA polymerase III subunit delta' [Oscillatoria sp. FACHB-1407]MBD2463340.1 DNA polymerase III subunit delta' [Oscillatoria sp. FACHB-1407]
MVSSVFDTLIGQSQAVELLTAAVERDRIAPAYLFVGVPGVGRSLAAQGFTELLLSPQGTSSPQLRSRIEQRNHPDLFWVEPTYLHQGKRISVKEAAELGVKRKTPPQIRLDQVREITQFLSRPPLEALRAVIVLEQAESMADAAANGLLKTLEEPGKATLILIASSVDALLPTIVSRCQRVRFQRLSTEDVAEVLQRTGHQEILQHPEILALAQGSPGEAIAHWQQLQAIDPELLETVTQPPRSLRHALELARQIDKELDVEAQLWFIDYLQHRYWQRQTHPQFLQLLETARRHLRGSVQPRLTWEVTLMGML